MKKNDKIIKVLIVDDSAIVRKIISRELSKHSDIHVVGTAVDPYIARDKIVKLKPDVVTLDLEMPRMDGLSFLSKLMQHHPIPVVVLSSLTPKNSETALKALDLGAVEVLCKPGAAYSAKEVTENLVGAVRIASAARIEAALKPCDSTIKPLYAKTVLSKTTYKILAIGASTGGTKAIEHILRILPPTTPGTVIVQHMPEHFSRSFAQRLNKLSQMEVKEASDGDRVLPGRVFIAPGNHHMVLDRQGGNYMVKINDGPRVHYHKPSVDVLFHTVAEKAGSNAVGVLLTGMGSDGAEGLLAMYRQGAQTLVQDEQTSIVFGMPKEAIKLGAAGRVLPLQDMAEAVIGSFKQLEQIKHKKHEVNVCPAYNHF